MKKSIMLTFGNGINLHGDRLTKTIGTLSTYIYVWNNGIVAGQIDTSLFKVQIHFTTEKTNYFNIVEVEK